MTQYQILKSIEVFINNCEYSLETYELLTKEAADIINFLEFYCEEGYDPTLI